jgi:uncharacterized protein
MLPVSLSFAAALALFSLFLAYRASKVRMGAKVLVGTGDNPLMETRMRAHANFAEYSPFVLALVALLELAGQSRIILWAVAIVYLLARIAHAFGMDVRRSNPARAGGALVTWAVLLGLALWAVAVARAAPAAAPHITMF